MQTVLGIATVVVGAVVAVAMWLNNGMSDKVLGLQQLFGWPLLGIAVMAAGVVVLVAR